MGKFTAENKFGCGFLGIIFQRSTIWLRKTSSVRALPSISRAKTSEVNSKYHYKVTHNHIGSPIPLSPVDTNLANTPPKVDQNSAKRSASIHPRQGRRPSNSPRSSTPSPSSHLKKSPGHDLFEERKFSSHQSPQSKSPIRSPSGNILPSGHLSILKQQPNLEETGSYPKTMNKNASPQLDRTMGNILRRHPSNHTRNSQALRNLDTLKSMGHEAYKQGNFEEALELYDRAIALDSNNPIYRNSKSAALIGLGRLGDAVLESKEAIRIHPAYNRAHHRLASLYFRLGEVDKASCHFKKSGLADNSEEMAKTRALQSHLDKCIEARKNQEWDTLIKESQTAISLGAGSAPQVFAMQAEALLRSHKHQEANKTYQKGQSLGIEFCVAILGPVMSAYLLMVGSQVNLVMGRFEEAVNMAERAAQLDPINNEIIGLVKKAKLVASARLSGNLLFNEMKYSEACSVYSQGLEHDSWNSILLCNRAACRSKLGQHEKAVEDCTIALNVRPSYSKARLRRADCNAKLGRWEASIQDYEMLIRETPGDVEVARALFEAKVELRRLLGEDTKDMDFGHNLIFVSNKEDFRRSVTSPGMSVVLFCHKAKHNQVLHSMEQVCKKFQSVNFLMVDIKEQPYLARTECVTSVPTFKIYKNGSIVKEIVGSRHELLENWLRMYIS